MFGRAGERKNSYCEMRAKEVAFAAVFAALFTIGDYVSFYNFQIVTSFMVVCAVYCGIRVLLPATFIYGLIDVIFGMGMYWPLVIDWQVAALTVWLILHYRPKRYGLASGGAFLTFTLVDAWIASLMLEAPYFAYLLAGVPFMLRGMLSGFVLAEILMRILNKRTGLKSMYNDD